MISIFDSRLLNVVIFLPLVVAAVVAVLPKAEKAQIRVITLIGMLVNFATCIAVFASFDAASPKEFQLEYRAAWLSSIGASFHVGIDGLAAALVLLTGLLGPLVVLGSWTFIETRVKEFHLALLVQQTAMLGALCALDVLLFYGFFEMTLVPMYLLIGVWGSEERQMAAMKFFVYTMVGSLLLLVALLGVYYLAAPAGARSFDYAFLYNNLLSAQREVAAFLMRGPGQEGPVLSATAQGLLRYGPLFFLAFVAAFAVKVPMFPFHTWLPDAHVQAPAAGSMILAGVLLKLGTFGFWRFAIPLFPNSAREYQVAFAVLGVIGIVYGALMCLAQRDVKRLIAYSSVSHLGFVLLGIFAFTSEGAAGGAYQMLNHGVSTGALFLLFGYLYERRHARLMSDYGGIAKVMPIFATLFLIITFSSIAVPGTNGFVGEFLILLGSFKSNLPLVISVLAATAVILGAAYMLLMVQRVFFGRVTHTENLALRDVNIRELCAAAPLVVLVIVMGLRPQPILDAVNASTAHFVTRAKYATLGDSQSDEAVRIKVLQLPAEADAAAPTRFPTVASK